MTKIETGRTSRAPTGGRPGDFCQSCGVRRLYGDPRSNDSWESRLSLDADQVDLLLIASAEFEELHDEAVVDALTGETQIPPFPTAVDFVDWLAPSVLPNPKPYDADGAQPRFDSGRISQRGNRGSHRHPDPLPFAGRKGAA